MQDFNLQRTAEVSLLLESGPEKREDRPDVTDLREAPLPGLVLEADVEFADVVKRRERGEPIDLSGREIIEAAEPSEPPPEDVESKERPSACPDIGAMVLKRMPAAISKLSPKGRRAAAHPGSMIGPLSGNAWRRFLDAKTFVAIDFETANKTPTSACAVGLVRCEEGVIVARATALIRPASHFFRYSSLHGIRWCDVESAPSFGAAWATLLPLLEGASFIAAHNAKFDRRVLRASAARAGLEPPAIPFLCTMQMAQRLWNLRRASLLFVSSELGISLDHHAPLSDAEACANIVLAAKRFVAAGAPAWLIPATR